MGNARTFTTLAALDAAFARGEAKRLAKSAETIQREFIAGQFAMARANVREVRRHRAFRADLAAHNPGALGLYHDREPALLQAAAGHRRAAHDGRRRLAELLTQSKAAA